MKQFTSIEQTAKLIELGFEKPNLALVKAESLCQSGTDLVWRTTNYERNFSIGELIEMLPKKIEAEVTDEYDSETAYLQIEEGWNVSYFNGWCTVEKYTRATELIDALYDMVVKLKEEGVI